MVALCCDIIRIMPPRKARTTPAAPAMTPAAIRKMIKDSVDQALAIERENVAAAAADAAAASATAGPTAAAGGSRARECTWKDFKNGDPTKFRGTEGATAMVRWFEKMESVFLLCNCPDDCKVKYATGTLLDGALSWWNSYAQPIGMENAYKLTWDQFKKLLTKKYCPRTEVKKLETEFYELVTTGNDIETYFRRFQELAALCPSMVTDNEKLIEDLIGGLPENIQGDVISFDPQTVEEVIRISQKLMAQVLKRTNRSNTNRNINNNNPTNTNTTNNNNRNNTTGYNNNKRRWENNRGNNNTQPPPKRQEVAKAYAAGPNDKKGYAGTLPKCEKCQSHHNPGRCPIPC